MPIPDYNLMFGSYYKKMHREGYPLMDGKFRKSERNT